MPKSRKTSESGAQLNQKSKRTKSTERSVSGPSWAKEPEGKDQEKGKGPAFTDRKGQKAKINKKAYFLARFSEVTKVTFRFKFDLYATYSLLKIFWAFCHKA